MNINSGVGDNAAGRYFAGSRRGGGSMFANNRQMRQYMQMRRDEMSHGAFLSNQNESLRSDRDENRGQREADREFNRTSLRTDANVQQDDWTANRDTARNDFTATRDTQRQDWSRGRARGHLTGMAADNPHLTNVDLDNASASFNPGFYRDKPNDSTGSTGGREEPLKVKSQRTDVPGTSVIGAPPTRLAIAAPPAGKAARAPRARREPGYVQQPLPGMRNTRQFKDTTLPPSTGSPATSTPITSGNETAIK
jgi:hypothetical protein